MKILLIGEFSSLHNYLKDGLIELGHDVVLYSNGDGSKRIPGSDGILYKQSHNGFKNLFYNYIQSFYISRKFCNFDVVQFISTRLYSYRIRNRIYKRFILKNKKVFYSASGGDYAMKKAYDNKLIDYYMYDEDDLFERLYSKDNSEGKFNIEFEHCFLNRVNGIIPSLYEYSIGYQNSFANLKSAIPFPINLQKIKYSENIVNDKIVFFHGITRPLNKGTNLIREALKKLAEKYPDRVEVIIKEKMPFEQYLEMIDKANVIVDQCKSYGYGINACISLAKGKIVMTGCRKEEFDCLGIDEKDNPMLLAMPSVSFLFKQMEWIVLNANLIPHLGEKSRQFVEKYHNHIEIAKKYLEVWNSK